MRNLWWAVQGLNLRPSACKADALPAELTAQLDILKRYLMRALRLPKLGRDSQLVFVFFYGRGLVTPVKKFLASYRAPFLLRGSNGPIHAPFPRSRYTSGLPVLDLASSAIFDPYHSFPHPQPEYHRPPYLPLYS